MGQVNLIFACQSFKVALQANISDKKKYETTKHRRKYKKMTFCPRNEENFTHKIVASQKLRWL